LLDGAPDTSRAEIGVEVDAFEVRIALPAVAVAASYGATQVVVVLEDGKSRATIQEINTASRWVVLVAVHAFEHVPAVIFSSGARRWLKVDLFPRVLTDVGDKKVSGDVVECAAPWVAQAVGPDLRQGRRLSDERVVEWHSVVAIRIAREIIAIDVHSQDLTQPGLQILSVLAWISATTAVTNGNVKIAVRTECDCSAIVVAQGKALRLLQDCPRGVGIGDVRVNVGDLVAGDDDVAIKICVIDEEEPVLSVIGGKSQAEQPLFGLLPDQVRDIQERSGKHRTVDEDEDLSRLLHDKYPAATVAGIGDGSWLREAGGNLLQLNSGQGAALLPQTVKSLKRPARETFRS